MLLLQNSDGVHIGFTLPDTQPEEKTKQVQEIMKRIPKDSEAVAVLVGTVDFLNAPAMAVVRLSEGQPLNLTEVPLPVRFIFILLGPPLAMDYHEVGRSLSTLMSNQVRRAVSSRVTRVTMVTLSPQTGIICSHLHIRDSGPFFLPYNSAIKHTFINS